MPADFSLIRPWDGSKDRAFEEICYQLLREPQDLPPDMVGRPIRTGNPDGGVEWYALRANGDQWGWQAKYIEDVDSLLGAMTATVKRVVAERPNLTKLTFCIPKNLSAGTARGRQTPGREKYDNKVAAWKKDIEGAKNIDFQLIQGSDLLERLTLPQHAGRRWFWWNEAYLGPEWLAGHQTEQSDVAGERYRPDLQVDIPIQDDLSALGFADSYFGELDRHKDIALRKLGEIGPPPAGTGSGVLSSAAELTAVIATFRDQVSADYQAGEVDPLRGLDRTVTTCATALAKVVENAQAFRTDLDTQPTEEGRPSLKEQLNHYAYRIRQTQNAVGGLRQFLDSSATSAVRQRFYFLTGVSGTGKTHLCLDAVQRALNENRPALVLFGNRFGPSDLWSSICEQLGLPMLGAEVLLGALEAVAEASRPHGHRFVIMIDALNDTKAQDYWADRLSALKAKLASRPLLALLVSCRDTYLDYVDPENRRTGFERVHPGFAGREFEATHKYFTTYGLEAPRIPLLLPEFTVPLFLLTYCAGLRGEGRTVPPPGHEGRTEIFERFLNISLRQVAMKLHLTPSSNKARAALDALLEEMAATGRENVEWTRAEALTSAQIPERTEWPDTAMGALLSQGLLSDEMVYEGNQHVRSVRVTYQAFSDFMILEHRLTDTAAGSVPDEAFAEWLSDASWGIREAAAVVLPEQHAVELPDLLEPMLVTGDAPDSAEGRRFARRMNNLDEMTVRSLPYRSATAITDRSIDLLNRHSQTKHGLRQGLDVFLLCAPQPDSRLNADALHRWLSQYSMADRDAIVGIPYYWDLEDETSALSRLARWAASGPYPAYEPQVVELACIPLVWMFSSPNRFMRGWITKALARLLAGHLSVAVALIERFADVNDPYVLERLITAAYGGILRGGIDHLTDAGRVAAQVLRFIFRRLDKLTPDALMLDSARGIIEWAVVYGQLPADALDLARPPYGLRRPGNPPTWDRLEERYRHGQGTTDQTSYGAIIWSLHGMADFGRYVVDVGIQHFSYVPLNRPLPSPEPPVEPRPVASDWQEYLRLLSPYLPAQARALNEGEESPEDAEEEIEQFASALSERQVEQPSASFHRPRRRPRDLHYRTELARRWIVQRTMSLGWRPELFGEFDRYLNYSRMDRESHKPERFGKKYQWIAYHELLARVADNYHYLPGWGEEPRPFGGIEEINDREIDPSLPPVPYREFQERIAKQGTWKPAGPEFPGLPPGSVDFDRYGGDFTAFLNDHQTLPYPSQIARIADSNGLPWILLDARLTHAARPVSEDRGMKSDRQFYSLHSWLLPSAEVPAAVSALIDELKYHSSASQLTDSHGHVDCCYFGELGWREMGCLNQHDRPPIVTRPGGTTLALTPTAERYTWEGVTWDCSIEESAHATLPSTFIQHSSNLRWHGDSAVWSDGDQLVMCYRPAAAEYLGELFAVREDWLNGYLAEQGMALIFAVRGQRDHQDGPREFSWTEFSLSGSYDAGTLADGNEAITSKNTAEGS